MSSSESFYWHDYETSGSDVATDRPVQFAGVRTDSAFNVVGEPLVIYSRPSPDYLPHPAAVRITGISPYSALEAGVSEREFIARIHEQFSQPGTCGVGYNSIRFDDEITRYTLYRNFFDPYARERGQGRSRWDLIDVARACYALRPDGVVWPRPDPQQGCDADKPVSFRLEDLAAANGIDHGKAHDALSDVFATIGLARCLRAAQAELFDTIHALRTRERVAELLNLSALKPVVHVSGMFGARRANLAVVVPIAQHPQNRNEIICADLGAHPDFLELPVDEIQSRLFTKQEDLPAGVSRPPLKTIKVNRAPVVLPTDWLQGAAAERLGLDGDKHRESLAALRGARDADPRSFVSRIQSIYADRKFEARADPDTMLYGGGFFDRTDSNQFPNIRAASGEQLKNRTWVFRDSRLPELLFRYRARNVPESLTEAEQDRWREHCLDHLTRSGPFTAAAFEQELAEERRNSDLSDYQRNVLDDLERYAGELLTALRA